MQGIGEKRRLQRGVPGNPAAEYPGCGERNERVGINHRGNSGKDIIAGKFQCKSGKKDAIVQKSRLHIRCMLYFTICQALTYTYCSLEG